MLVEQDQGYLLKALALAKGYKGQTRENPAVAAVIVNDEGLVSYGIHRGSGDLHAEVVAIKAAKLKSLTGCTIYVVLEPCVHFGKTPPCVNAIAESGIKKVVYAFADTNPLVLNKAQAILNDYGINCQQIKLREVDDFYREYQYWQLTKKSWLSAKIAMSKNKVICQKNGAPISITSSDCNYWVHQQRLKHSAILTTAQTIRNDNPSFSVRYRAEKVIKPLIILSASANIALDAKCFLPSRDVLLIHSQTASKVELENCKKAGVRCYLIKHEITQAMFWIELCKLTASLGYCSLWAELGAFSLQAALGSKQVNLYYQAVAYNKIIDGMVLQLDKDVLLKPKNMLKFSQDEVFVYDFSKE